MGGFLFNMTEWVMKPQWQAVSLTAVTQYNISLSRLRWYALRTPSSPYRQLHSPLFSPQLWCDVARWFPSWLGEEYLADCIEVSYLLIKDLFTSDFTFVTAEGNSSGYICCMMQCCETVGTLFLSSSPFCIFVTLNYFRPSNKFKTTTWGD